MKYGPQYTTEQETFLKENYHKYTNPELSKLLNKPVDGIFDKARRMGLCGNKQWIQKNIGKVRRRFSFNYDYFETIDTHEKAYWYGFLWADGCITDNNCLIVDLHNKDSEHLSVFNNHISSTYSIKYTKQMARLCLRSEKVKSDLNKLNIVPRKTYLDNLPIITNEFFFSWLLGMFDGDGYCGVRSISICTRPIIAEWLIERLRSYGIAASISFIKNKQNVNLKIFSKDNIERFCQLLTENIDFNLTRKYPRYRITRDN